MLFTQPSHHWLHLLRQEISREPHAHFLPSRETRASCWSFLGLQDSQRLFVKPSVSCLLYLHHSRTLTCAFLPASESLCRCCWAQLLHITISNIQLHLYPRRLQGKRERSLTSYSWDSIPAPSHTPEPKTPNYKPLRISFCWCPRFNWVCRTEGYKERMWLSKERTSCSRYPHTGLQHTQDVCRCPAQHHIWKGCRAGWEPGGWHGRGQDSSQRHLCRCRSQVCRILAAHAPPRQRDEQEECDSLDWKRSHSSNVLLNTGSGSLEQMLFSSTAHKQAAFVPLPLP